MAETEEHDHGPSTLAIFGWMTLMIAIIAAFALLRQDMQVANAGLTLQARQQARKIEQLQAQITELQKRTPAAPDEAVANTLKDTSAQLAAVNDRLLSLENEVKRPAAPATPASNTAARLLMTLQGKVMRGEPYAGELDTLATTPNLDADALNTLRATATTGVPTESKLRSDLQAILASASSAVPQTSTLARMNAHLGGLVTIKPRASADTYASLREDAPVDTLAERVRALPPESQASLQPWLQQVEARSKALAAMTTLETRLLPVQ